VYLVRGFSQLMAKFVEIDWKITYNRGVAFRGKIMTESRSKFKTGLDSYSAWTDCKSSQQQYKTVTQSQAALQVSTCSPIFPASNPTFIIKVA